MRVIITVCDTCKREGWNAETDPQTDGEKLNDHLARISARSNNLELRRHSCLMGCDFGCNVSLQQTGKLTYALGMFEPDAASAEAIVEFAEKYHESETGQVPYRCWPEGIKGHFRSRIPPIDRS